MTSPLYIIGTLAFIYAGLLIGYIVGWRSAIEEAARASCEWCTPPHPERPEHVGSVDYAGWHYITWPSGNASTVKCGGHRIRALKGGRS